MCDLPSICQDLDSFSDPAYCAITPNATAVSVNAIRCYKSMLSQILHFPHCLDLLVTVFLLDNCRNENIRSGSLISDHSGHSTCQS